jgi:hypothetical protein
MCRFNCFAYALGIWDHPDYIGIVNDESDSSVINSGRMAEMLGKGVLVEIDSHEVKANDMVLYFHGRKVTHAATLDDTGALRSKWGRNEVYEHGLWEVPASYGKCARYFRRPAPADVFNLLRRRGS